MNEREEKSLGPSSCLEASRRMEMLFMEGTGEDCGSSTSQIRCAPFKVILDCSQRTLQGGSWMTESGVPRGKTWEKTFILSPLGVESIT